MLCAPNNPVVAVLLSLVEIGTIQAKDWIAPHDALPAPALSVAAKYPLVVGISDLCHSRSRNGVVGSLAPSIRCRR
jgi:hypothetical protein